MSHEPGAAQPLPFADLRVVDLSRDVAGAYCTRLLAGLGAEVIKVEPPGSGDPLRALGPFYQDTPGPERGALHLHLNLSKKSVTLDVAHAAGRRLLDRLLERADAVVETFRPSDRQRLGLGYEELCRPRPDLVVASISGFGVAGPYADFSATEGVVMAMSGMTNLGGDPAEPPLQPGGNTGYCVAGQYAAVAIASAWMLRWYTGEGQHIDVSVADAVASITEISSQRMVTQGKPQERTGNWQGAARGVYPCRDGYIGVVLRGRERLRSVASWLGLEELVAERFGPFYNNEELDSDLEEEMNGLLTAGFLERDKLDIYHATQGMHIPFGYVADFQEVLDAPQLNARGFFAELDHPVVGRQRYASVPFTSADLPWRLERAPLLGEHNEEVYRRLLGLTQAKLASLKRQRVV